jgi:hypothetical protein
MGASMKSIDREMVDSIDGVFLERQWKSNERDLNSLRSPKAAPCDESALRFLKTDPESLIEQLESAQDFLEYCLGFDGPPPLPSVLGHSLGHDLPCPFCSELIPSNENFLGQPTVRCWNCRLEFMAPEAWRDPAVRDRVKVGWQR